MENKVLELLIDMQREIKEINNKVNSIYDENYDESKNIEENIKIFHDYIINNTRYDTNNTSGDASINSSTAYGVLIEGNGICSLQWGSLYSNH